MFFESAGELLSAPFPLTIWQLPSKITPSAITRAAVSISP